MESILKDIMHRQKDDRLIEEEEMRLRIVAQAYALCEHSVAVMSNMRTGQSYVYYGGTNRTLGFGHGEESTQLDSVWEEEIFARLSSEDWKLRCLQELTFYRMVMNQHSADAYAWQMHNVMRMRDRQGGYHYVKHRIRYFGSADKQGVCYALCLYNLTCEASLSAYVVNTLTGEKRKLEVNRDNLLSDREKSILKLISLGRSSKMIADALGISKNTVDRHRQNIILKLQVGNTTEACHKARELELI